MAAQAGPKATVWAAEPDISARSVLVTIFGDTLLPAASSVWLSQLFKLTDRFGFSGRLIRTSMFRLATDGWLTNERVGRQSRYHLTPLAIEESEQASDRIYSLGHSSWSGSWTLAVLTGDMADDDTWKRLAEHLGWHGFITLSPGLLASPNTTVDRVRDLCEVIEPKLRVPLATATFADLDQLVDDGFFAAAFDIEGLETSYRSFRDRYGTLLAQADRLTFTDPLDAFAMRTMLVHDLRRIRLRTIDVPPELLPSGWIGSEILPQTAEAYRTLSTAAAPVLSEILDTEYPAHLADRFAPART